MRKKEEKMGFLSSPLIPKAAREGLLLFHFAVKKLVLDRSGKREPELSKQHNVGPRRRF